mmetsp:Transcript_60870/g.149050  ORF Transcript_60870/g.149050 Transcript_60870/m.149050 type:complete len:83 (-) Transcript_60870:35-283(-)
MSGSKMCCWSLIQPQDLSKRNTISNLFGPRKNEKQKELMYSTEYRFQKFQNNYMLPANFGIECSKSNCFHNDSSFNLGQYNG